MRIRIVANLHAMGGGELSVCRIARMLMDAGHTVHLHPAKDKAVHGKLPVPVECLDHPFERMTEAACDVLFFYANDAAYGLDDRMARWLWLAESAARRVMCLNFVLGDAKDPWFRNLWDLTLFLNSTKAAEWPNASKRVLPPPVDIEPLLSIQPDYSLPLRLVRISRYQRKYEESDITAIMDGVWRMHPEASFSFMAAPPFLRSLPSHRVQAHPWDGVGVRELLSGGNLFWYRLPSQLRDQGPRVIVEAMAAGLPCIVDDRDGPADRVTPETGWKCEGNRGYLDAVREILDNPSVLREKGEAARERASEHFRPERWVEAIVGSGGGRDDLDVHGEVQRLGW